MRENKNIILNIFWILLGAGIEGAYMMGQLDDIYNGFGIGLIVVGGLQLIKAFRYQKNPTYKESVDVEVNDERNKYLRMKAWSWAGYSFVLICGVATITFMVLGRSFYMQIAAWGVCLMIFLYWICYMILQKKY